MDKEMTMNKLSNRDAINRIWTDESVTDINGPRLDEMLRTVADKSSSNDDKCMHDSGCDRKATKMVRRPDHWHDDVFCAECAPEGAIPLMTTDAAKCETCKGTGRIEWPRVAEPNGERCSVCRGTGKVLPLRKDPS